MKTFLLQTSITVVLTCAALYVSAQAGTLDSSFGINGKVSSSFGLYGGQFADIAVQQDGKIVSTGTYFLADGVFGFLVVRHKSNGSLDSSFGINGKAVTYSDSINPWLGIHASIVIIQPDNKILVGGSKSISGVYYGDFAMARYLPNGNLDSSFGLNGLVITDVDPGFNPEAGITSLAIQSDGKILAGGFSDGHCLIRYWPNGVIDSSFGINGKAQHVSGFDNINDFVLLDNGKIITAGTSPWYDESEFTRYQIKLSRFKANGVLDSSFGQGGEVLKLFFNSYEAATSLAIVENNKILVCGVAYNPSLSKNVLVVMRLNLNGSFDGSFGTGGTIIYNTIFDGYGGPKLAVQPDGKFLISTGLTGNQLYRFNSTGVLDSSFGVNGLASATFMSSSVISSLAIQEDGKIMVGSNPSISLARFKGDEPITVSLLKNMSVTEGNAGLTPVQFKVVLNKPSTKTVLVNYTTKNLNAIAGSDYNSSDGLIAIKAGKTTGNLILNVIGDNVREPNEKFALVLSNPVNAVLGAVDSVTCAIRNDDAIFALNSSSEDNVSKQGVSIYPNPVTDLLVVKGLPTGIKTQMVILNSAGYTILTTTAYSAAYNWDIKSLPAGQYFLKTTSENNTSVLPFIKQ